MKKYMLNFRIKFPGCYIRRSGFYVIDSINEMEAKKEGLKQIEKLYPEHEEIDITYIKIISE